MQENYFLLNFIGDDYYMDNVSSEKLYYSVYDTQEGKVTVISNCDAIVGLRIGEEAVENALCLRTPLMDKAVSEITEYFNGERKYFDLPLKLEGSDYQKKVWNILRNIPYGKTITYKDVAEEMGKKKSFRAVGGAIGKNPILLLIPCHRVVGLNGSLTGYAGGIEIKKNLLKLEKAI